MTPAPIKPFRTISFVYLYLSVAFSCRFIALLVLFDKTVIWGWAVYNPNSATFTVWIGMLEIFFLSEFGYYNLNALGAMYIKLNRERGNGPIPSI